MSRWVIRELGLLALTTCWRAIPPSSEGLLLHTPHPQLFCLPDLKALTAHPDLNFCSLHVHLGAWRTCPVLTSCPGALQVYHWAVMLGSAHSGYNRLTGQQRNNHCFLSQLSLEQLRQISSFESAQQELLPGWSLHGLVSLTVALAVAFEMIVKTQSALLSCNNL